MILSNNIIKYFIIICVLYYVIKLVPTQKLNDRDTIIIISLFIMSFVFIENYYTKKYISESFSPLDTQTIITSPTTTINSSIQQYIPPNIQPTITQPPITQPPITPPPITPPTITQPTITQPTITPPTITQPTITQPTITPPPPPITQPILNDNSEIKIDNKIKNIVNDEMLFNYFTLLINDLNKNGFINNKEVDIMMLKIESGLLTINDLIKSLEYIKSNSSTIKLKDDSIYNELNKDFYNPIGDKIANEWDNDYNLLNSDKWTVPMKQPPQCVNTTPCKVCEYDTNPNYTPLKHWDNSRYVSQYKINKNWIANQ